MKRLILILAVLSVAGVAEAGPLKNLFQNTRKVIRAPFVKHGKQASCPCANGVCPVK